MSPRSPQQIIHFLMGVEEIPHFANRGEKLKGGAYGLKMLNICSTNIYKNP